MYKKTAKNLFITMIFGFFMLMLGVTFCIPASFASAVSQYVNNVGETISVGTADYTIQTDDTGKFVNLPDVTISGGTLSVTAIAQNATKEEQTISSYTSSNSTNYSGGKLYLTDNISSYKVEYVVTSADGVETSTTINVDVESDSPYFEWGINSQQIVPTQVNRTTSKGEATTIVFPYPTIYNGNGDAVNLQTMDNGTASDTTDDYQIPINNEDLTVTLVGPSGNTISIDEPVSSTGYYKWTIPADASYGLYTVTYRYSADNSYTIRREFNFYLVETTIETELLLNGWSDETGTSSLATSWALFVEQSLPKATIVNTQAGDAEVDVYTEITITCVPTDKDTYGDEIVYNFNNTPSLREFKFTPTVAGRYTVHYVMTDFFGNTIDYTSDINGITATKTSASGSGFVVAAYTTEDVADMQAKAEEGTLPTAEDTVPSIVATGSTWTLPAIFGIDELYDYDELSFSREITYTKAGNSNSTTEVYSATSTNDDRRKYAYETIEYTFTEATNYTIVYRVRDGAGNSLLSQSFTVQVEDDYVDTTAPVVNFTGLATTTVSAGRDISFKVSAVDYREDDPTVVADANVNLVVTYKINDGEAVTMTLEDGYYTIPSEVTEGLTNGTTIEISAVATDDFDNDITQTRTITISNYADDTTSATASEFTFDEAFWQDTTDTLKTFNTLDEITLPSITFRDNNPYMGVAIEVTCNGNTISGGTFYRSSGNGRAITMGGETFTANLAGTYVVKYTATDVNGNKTVKSFNFTVNGQQMPILTLGDFEGTYEAGDVISLDNFSVTINSQEVEAFNDKIITNLSSNLSEEQVVEWINNFLTYLADPSTYAEQLAAYQEQAGYDDLNNAVIVQILGPVANVQNTNPNSIIAGDNGTITLKYWAVSTTGEFNATPRTVSFSTEDTTNPTLIVNFDGPEPTFDYNSDPDATEEENRVQIPQATATDFSGVQDITITAKYESDTQNLTITPYATDSQEYKDGYYGYFVANKNGNVVVTYEVSDLSNNANTTTLEYTIGVGDVSAPDIILTDLQNALEDRYNLGNEVTLDLSLVRFNDAEALDYTNSTFTVSVTRDGETVSVEYSGDNDRYATFKFDKTGTYTISFNIEDSAGNVAETKSITYTISTDTTENIVPTTVWGTILIIVALVALGVVIFFFIKPTKAKVSASSTRGKKDDRSANKNNKNDKKGDNKNDKIVV